MSSDNARNAGGLNAVSRGTGLENQDRTLAASNLWAISDHAISETRAQVTRSRLDAPPNDLTGPAVTISGIASFGTRDQSRPPRATSTSSRSCRTPPGCAAITRSRPASTCCATGSTIAFPGALQGVYSFSSLANFLAGRYSSFQQAFGEAETRQTNDNLGVFVQDEWRAGAAPDGERRPALRPAAAAVARPHRSQQLLAAARRGVGPAWRRAQGAARRGRPLLRRRSRCAPSPTPCSATASHYRVAQVGPTAPGAPTFPNVCTEFPAGVRTNITTIDPDIESSSSMQAVLQYEQQLGATWRRRSATSTCAAATSSCRATSTCRPPPIPRCRTSAGRIRRFANNGQFQSIGDSWYDGVTVALTKRPASWGSVRLSYTFSKGLDTSGNFFFSQPQNAERHRRRARALRQRSAAPPVDQRHADDAGGGERHAVPPPGQRLAVQLHLHLHVGAAVQHPAPERPQRRHQLQRPARGRRAQRRRGLRLPVARPPLQPDVRPRPRPLDRNHPRRLQRAQSGELSGPEQHLRLADVRPADGGQRPAAAPARGAAALLRIDSGGSLREPHPAALSNTDRHSQRHPR